MPPWHSPKTVDHEALSGDDGQTLLHLARRAIADVVGVDALGTPTLDTRGSPSLGTAGTGPESSGHGAALDAPGRCFVTLHVDGRLRGCIGSLHARRSLRQDVITNARAAAMRDRRFTPLTADEFAHLDIEVSVLGPATILTVRRHAEAFAALRPGVDGAIIEAPGHRATFLPQVWTSLPDPDDFLNALQRKAGLTPGSWRRSYTLSRYAVTSFSESHGGAGHR